LDAERALAVAGARAADVEHAQVLVTGAARGLEAETHCRRIRRVELGEQGVDVYAPTGQRRKSASCGRRGARPRGELFDRALEILRERRRVFRGRDALRPALNGHTARFGTRERRGTVAG